MKRVLCIIGVVFFCLMASGTSDASTWTNYGGYQPPECCSGGGWNGISPAPQAINPPEFVKRINKWNIVVKEGISSPVAQIWWGEDGTILYKIHFPSEEAAHNWIQCKTPSIAEIQRAIKTWRWTVPTIGKRHKWMPLSEVP